MVKTRSSGVEDNSTNDHYPSSWKGAKKNVKKRMAEAPVDLKQPRPKRNRRRTQKVTDNEKHQHEKKKLKTFKPPIIEELDDDAKQEKRS